MQKRLIALLLLLCIYSADCVSCNCKKFENSVYQVTITLSSFQPFYGLLTMYPNGIYYQTNNIANGNHTAEVGINAAFNLHSGFYECSSNNTITLIAFGYIYQTNDVPVLKANGVIGVDETHLQFLNNDNRECTGTFKFGFYTTGSNPFDSSNIPLSVSPVATLTCQYLSGRGFRLPPTTS